MLQLQVGRRVAFEVTSARVSFPRRESYGLEARFKVIYKDLRRQISD